jgi:hypothetical protein
MFPTYGKKLMLKNKFLAALTVSLAGVFIAGIPVLAQAKPADAKKATKSLELEAPIPGVVTVSDYEFNTFVFPGTLKRVFFPAGAPVSGKPLYLSENTQVMLQFSKGSDTPVQMVAELENGAVVTLRVLPRGIPGVVHSVNGARAKRISAPRAEGSSDAQAVAPRGEDIELLKHLMTHREPPAQFEPVKLPATARFDKFSVVPLASWSDGGTKRIMIFSLVAVPGQTAVVAPPQFYRPGITAVMLDGDVVDANTMPQLFVVEELADE